DWQRLQRAADRFDATAADEQRARRAAGDQGRFTRNFVVQGTAAEWALAWLADLRQRLARLPAIPTDGRPTNEAPADGSPADWQGLSRARVRGPGLGIDCSAARAGRCCPASHVRAQGDSMSITVKALQKTGPDEPFRVGMIERRAPRADDVVIDIRAAGICHSDIHTIRNEWGQAHFPLTVGHEIAGVVEAVGDAVTDWKVGDRVGVGCVVDSCGECEECAAGQEQNCLRGNFGTYNSTDVDGTITQGG